MLVEYRVQNLAIFKAEATNYSEQEAPKDNDPFAAQNQETENAVEQTVKTLETDSDPFADM